MLDQREKDLENIAIWGHLHKEEVKHLAAPLPGWEVFREYKTAVKKVAYAFPLYTDIFRLNLPDIVWA
eukprot:120315-Prorocentrum_lima.AAC.1